MKELRLSPYYDPEQISSSHLDEDLQRAYAAVGITTEIFCPTPTRGITPEVREQYKKIKYEEKLDGKVIVHRFSMFREGRNPIMRALRYVLVNLIQYFKGAWAEDIDVVYGASTPPTQGVLCALVAKRLSKKHGKKVPFIFNLQDVFPDSLVTADLTRKDSLLYKIGDKISNYTYRNADAIIVISQDIKRNIMKKGVPEEKIHLIYNWIDTAAVQPVAPEDNRLYEELGLSRDTFKVVYAGNLGKMQGIDTVLAAAKILQENSNIEFVIFGKGAEEDALKKQVAEENLSNVKFFPLFPAERVPEVYSLGDACVVCCKAGTGGGGVPSKTWTIMACGRPLLVSFDAESELCHTVENAKAGLCSDAGDGEALAQRVLQLYGDPQEKIVLGQNARNYAVAYAGKESATQKYIQLIYKTVEEA